MASRSKGNTRASENHGASPGKIFIGGLHRDTTMTMFLKHFGAYGEIVDSVIMKNKITGQPRGFGFVTYADPSVVDKVIEENHVILGKPVEIKRTIPKGSTSTGQSVDMKTKKIFVGGIPTTLTEEVFKGFFSRYGRVVEHEIIRDHETNRSRGFGFIVFDNEDSVDSLLSKGNRIDLDGSEVEIKKAEPKKGSNPPPSSYGSNYRSRSFEDGPGSYGGANNNFGTVGFGPSYRSGAGYGSRFGGYGGYGDGAGEFGGGYGGFGGSSLGGYRSESSFGYSGRPGSFSGGSFGSSSGNFGGSALGSYRRDEGFGGYDGGSNLGGYDGGSSFGGGFDFGSGAGFGSGGAYGNRTGFGGAGRYHPYSR